MVLLCPAPALAQAALDCDANTPPRPTCRPQISVAVDDDCRWSVTTDDIVLEPFDPDGDAVACAVVPPDGRLLQPFHAYAFCEDACGRDFGSICRTRVRPLDEMAPQIEIDRPVVTFRMQSGWVVNWNHIADVCQMSWVDNCWQGHQILDGIVGIEALDPDEVVLGEPGFFFSRGILADWAGFQVNLDLNSASPRSYVLTHAVLDVSGNLATVDCRVDVLPPEGPDDDCDGEDDDADGAVDEDAICSVCPNGGLGDATGPGVAAGRTEDAVDGFVGTCGGAGGEDVTFTWAAAADGRYTFDSRGSPDETVLYLLDGGCFGVERACGADGAVILDLEAGEAFVIVIDTPGGAGDFVLDIDVSEAGHCDDGVDNDGDGDVDCGDAECGGEPVCPACPDVDLGSAVGPAVGGADTRFDLDDSTISCGSIGSRDVAFAWTSAASATWRFDTGGSAVDAALAVADGCGGSERACDASTGAATVLVPVVAGGSVVVIAETPVPGVVTLNIEALEVGFCDDGVDNDGDGFADCDDTECGDDSACPTCPEFDLGEVVGEAVLVGDTRDGSGRFSASCGGADARERTFTWTAPVASRYVFDTLGSGADTVLSLRAGACEGPELVCDDDVTPGVFDARVEVDLEDGDTVIGVVDGGVDGGGGFTLAITPLEVGHCDDGVDNDGDGATDCGDDECVDDPACPTPACPAHELGDAVGIGVFLGTTVGAGNTLAGSCGGALADEITFRWRAPKTGFFTVDTLGSVIDTVLYVRQGACDAAEIDCNDDADDGLLGESSLVLETAVGAEFIIVLDSFAVSGDVQLNIRDDFGFGGDAGTGDGGTRDGGARDGGLKFAAPARQFRFCPDRDLGASVGVAVAVGSTVAEINDFAAPCGGDGEDVAFQWRAPRVGRFRFDAAGSSPLLRSVIYLLADHCDGALLACGGDGSVERRFEAGESVVVVLDSPAPGNFTLNIHDVGGAPGEGVDTLVSSSPRSETRSASCPDFELGAGTGSPMVTGSTAGESGDVEGSCGGDGPELTYVWRAPFASAYEISAADAAADTVLYVRAGACGAEELACAVGATIRAVVDLEADEPITIVVDSDNAIGGAFALHIDVAPTEVPDAAVGPVATCPVGDLGDSVGESVAVGMTRSGAGDWRGLCGGIGAEATWRWTAPADGVWHLDTEGSDFDTVLYVRRATCDGEELTCDDDDADGVTSAIELDAIAGETYVIVVDSYGMGGRYRLNIRP